MKVAVVQMVSGADVPANLGQARALLRQAAAEGAELAVLPEYFCLMGGHDADKLAIQETPGAGPLQQFLAESANELGLWLVGGTLPLSSGQAEPGRQSNRVFNSTLVFSPQGTNVARYDKIHLFRFDNGHERYDESAVQTAGSQRVCFDLPSIDGHTWRIGLSVCYDLRFAELYRHYAQAGADCLYAPGVRSREQIKALVDAVAPSPVNLLVGSTSELSVADIAALGVRRISVGGALARAAWGGFQRAARLLADTGRFDGFADSASGRELDAFFAQDRQHG